MLHEDRKLTPFQRFLGQALREARAAKTRDDYNEELDLARTLENLRWRLGAIGNLEQPAPEDLEDLEENFGWALLALQAAITRYHAEPLFVLALVREAMQAPWHNQPSPAIVVHRAHATHKRLLEEQEQQAPSACDPLNDPSASLQGGGL